MFPPEKDWFKAKIEKCCECHKIKKCHPVLNKYMCLDCFKKWFPNQK